MTTPPARRWGTPVLDRQYRDTRDLDTMREAWLKDTSKSEDTWRKYRGYFEVYRTWLKLSQGLEGEEVISRVIHAHIEEYIGYLRAPHDDQHPGECFQECFELPYEGSALNTKISALSSFYGYCIKSQRRTDNPAKNHNLDTTQRKNRTILLGNDLLRGMNLADRINEREPVIWGMFFGAGLRCAELAWFDVSNFEVINDSTDDWRMTFRRKGGKTPTIDVPRPVVPYLRRYIGNRVDGPLIRPDEARWGRSTAPGKSVAPSTIFDVVKKIGKHLDRPDLGTHDGKATATTLALTHPGATEHRVKLYFGHSDFNTTVGYYHPGQLQPGHNENPLGIDWYTQAR